MMNEDAVMEANEVQSHLFDNIMLDLHIEIGRTKIKISELMTLNIGSVIELDQKAQEPLRIYANNKQIAKGQIISSNGKYNIRIL